MQEEEGARRDEGRKEKKICTRTGSGPSSHVCLVMTLCTAISSIHYYSGFTYINTYLRIRSQTKTAKPNQISKGTKAKRKN